MDLMTLRASLMGLSAFRTLRDTDILSKTAALLDNIRAQQGEQALETYTELFYALRSKGYDGLGAWLWDVLRYTPSTTS